MSFEATCRMVGLDWGLGSKHANANLIMLITPSATRFSGSGIRWSITSFNNACWLICELDEEENADAEGDEMRSPGCIPIITSIVTVITSGCNFCYFNGFYTPILFRG